MFKHKMNGCVHGCSGRNAPLIIDSLLSPLRGAPAGI